jgi:hypothetical protein
VNSGTLGGKKIIKWKNQKNIKKIDGEKERSKKKENAATVEQ